MRDAHVRRLTEIDSLRGVAALSVLAFHFTYKYGELYGYADPLPFAASWGYLGVNLFFVISGFVIFMTLDRTRVPMDFIVSRASRLYPSYWTALLLTFVVTHALGLPGKEVSAGVLLLNVPMFQQLFSVPLVDNVYWTLMVELLFYGLAFALYLAGWLHRVLWALVFLLALRAGYWAAAAFLHVDLPWRINQLLILEYIPFFALGIVAYRLAMARDRTPLADAAVATLALVSLLTDSPLMAGVGLVCFLAVWMAAAGRLPFLRFRVIVWFGVISYPLYLVHENIGWSIIRTLERAGWRSLPAVALTTVIVIALAAAVSRWVERPAMAAIRGRYRARRAPDAPHSASPARFLRVRQGALTALAVVAVASAGVAAWRRVEASDRQAAAHLAAVQPPREAEIVPCPAPDTRPIVLLALGQSNAGNHGGAPQRSASGALWSSGRCYAIADPLAGATGNAGSIWSRLAQAVGVREAAHPLLLAVIAVDASRASDWHRPDRLAPLVARTLEGLRAQQLQVGAVLWQQGEADNLAHTPPSIYARDLAALVAELRAHGVDAPVFIAASTRCRTASNDDLRAAAAALIARDPGVRLGPDTDALADGLRSDGCHFNDAGLERAAQLWLDTLQRGGVLAGPPITRAASR